MKKIIAIALICIASALPTTECNAKSFEKNERKISKQSPSKQLGVVLRALEQAHTNLNFRTEINDLRRNDYTQEELLSMSDLVLQEVMNYDELGSTQAYVDLKNFMHTITTEIKDYKVDGFGIGSYFDNALILGGKRYSMTVCFKNSRGEIEKRDFTLNYSTLGFQFHLIRYEWSFIFALGTNLNLYSATDEITLGTGVFTNFHPGFGPGLGITVLPITNGQGCLVTCHFNVSLIGCPIQLGLALPNGSLKQKNCAQNNK